MYYNGYDGYEDDRYYMDGPGMSMIGVIAVVTSLFYIAVMTLMCIIDTVINIVEACVYYKRIHRDTICVARIGGARWRFL